MVISGISQHLPSEDLGDYKETVSHRFEVTDEALTSEYNRATEAEGALNSLIQQTAAKLY